MDEQEEFEFRFRLEQEQKGKKSYLQSNHEEFEKKVEHYKKKPKDALSDTLSMDLPLGIVEQIPAGIQALGGVLAGGLGGVVGALIPGDTAAAGYERSSKAVSDNTSLLTPKTKSGQAIGAGISAVVDLFKEDAAILGAGEGQYADPNAPEWAKKGRAALAAGMSAAPELSMMAPFVGGKGKKKAAKPEANPDAVMRERALQAKLETEAVPNGGFPTPESPHLSRQMDMFPAERVKETIKDHEQVTTPGLAEPYDAARMGEYSDYNAAGQRALGRRQLELPLETPETMYGNKKGEIASATQMADPKLALARGRGPIDPGQVAFREMGLELAGESPVRPDRRVDPMSHMAKSLDEIEQQRKKNQDMDTMWNELKARYNAEKQHGQTFDNWVAQEEAGKARTAEAAAKAAEEKRLAGMTEAQRLIEERQREMEFQTKKQTTLDFNAAERARQEAAEVPGLGAEKARRSNLLEEQKYAEHLKKVDEDPRVLKADERVTKAEELYIKVAEAFQQGKATKKHLERIEKDLENLRKAADWVRSNAEYEGLANVRKGQKITTNGPFGRQRGAMDFGGFMDEATKWWQMVNRNLPKKGDTLTAVASGRKAKFVEAFLDEQTNRVIVAFQYEGGQRGTLYTGLDSFRETERLQKAIEEAESRPTDLPMLEGHELGERKNKHEFNILDDKGNNLRKGPHKFKGPGKGQAGAWIGPQELIKAAEKMSTGMMSAREYLLKWEGAFHPKRWNDALEDLRDPKAKSQIVFLSPREFHRLALPRGNDVHGDRARIHQNIKGAIEGKDGLLDMPHLWVQSDEATGVAQVIGHEGRHRMDVFREAGVNKVPVIIRDEGIRWGETDFRPRVIRPEYMKGMDAMGVDALDMKFPKLVMDEPRDPFKGPGKSQAGAMMIGPREPKKPLDVLADKIGIERVLGEVAPSQWTPEQAKEAAMKASDVDQNFIQKAANIFTKGGLYQALKTHNPIVRYTEEGFLKADQLARADIRDLLHARLTPTMQRLSAKEQGQIWPLIELADLEKKPLDLEMLARHGFNEKQLDMVKTHRYVMDEVYKSLNKARAAAGKPPVEYRTAYAAMRATGDFRRLVYDKQGGDVIGIIGSDYRWKTNRLKEQMEEKAYFVGEEKYYGGVPRERGSANEAFMSAIEFLAEGDKRVQDFVNVLNDIRTQEVYNFLNTKTHTMDKKGIPGMSGRKGWKNAEQNALEGFQAQLNYAEAGIKWGHLSEAAEKVSKLINDPDIKMPNAKQWAEEYMYNSLGFNPSKFGRSLEAAVAEGFKAMGVGYSVGRHLMAGSRKVVNTALLGLNPAFWATNVVQPFKAMPGMKAYLVAKGLNPGFDIAGGYAYLAAGAKTSMKEMANLKKTPLEQAAMEYAHQHHVYGSDLVEHSNRPRKGFGTAVDTIGNFATGPIESTSRRAMFYGFVHMLNDNGMSMKNGLFEAAQNLTDIALNNYSAVERPQFYNKLGPVGDIAANLQSYKHNELSRIALFARQIGEEKSARPILTEMGMTVATAGITGMIAFAEADWLYRQITKAAGKPDSLSSVVIRMSEKAGKAVYDATGGAVDAPYVASHGVFSLIGLDMSKRLGMQNLIPDSAGEALFPGGSKLADMASSAATAAWTPTEINAKRAVRENVPAALTGIVDEAWFTKKTPRGPMSVNPDKLSGTAYRNDTDVWAKRAGFTGINESVQKQKTWDVESKSRAYSDLRQKPLAAMKGELFTNGKISKESVQKYLKYRGSIESLEGDINRYAMEQNLTPQDLAYLRAEATNSVASMEKARDYLEMFKKDK